MWQFGGLAVMPLAIIVLSGDRAVGPWWSGHLLVAISFLATGMGAHLTQTAGLALAADRASEKTRPQVVAMLYVSFLIGMGIAALAFGFLLSDFSKYKLIQVVQGAAVVTLILNIVALWKQEKLVPTDKKGFAKKELPFLSVLGLFIRSEGGGNLLLVVFFGTLALSMQDILLEPYGGEILNLSVSATTNLTALWVFGALLGLVIASKLLKEKKRGPIKSIVLALLVAIVGFCCVIMSDPMNIVLLYFIGSILIGLGTGLFAVSTLIIAMTIPISKRAGRGLVLGSWGAAQATAAGLGIGLGGILNDLTKVLISGGDIAIASQNPAFSYLVVYHLEILLLFFTLVLLGPLSQYLSSLKHDDKDSVSFGFSEMPT
jgi:BCD family chlorophyll transporter-like MFS transporter